MSTTDEYTKKRKELETLMQRRTIIAQGNIKAMQDKLKQQVK